MINSDIFTTLGGGDERLGQINVREIQEKLKEKSFTPDTSFRIVLADLQHHTNFLHHLSCKSVTPHQQELIRKELLAVVGLALTATNKIGSLDHA